MIVALVGFFQADVPDFMSIDFDEADPKGLVSFVI